MARPDLGVAYYRDRAMLHLAYVQAYHLDYLHTDFWTFLVAGRSLIRNVLFQWLLEWTYGDGNVLT